MFSQSCQFTDYPMIRIDGLTSVEILRILSEKLPKVPSSDWFMLSTSQEENFQKALMLMIGSKGDRAGEFLDWKWEFIPDILPEVTYWNTASRQDEIWQEWSGVILMTTSEGKSFYLVSYLNSRGGMGEFVFVSTRDRGLIEKLIRDVTTGFIPNPPGIKVHYWGDESFFLAEEEHQDLLLESNMRDDILTQVHSFFKNKEVYAKLGVPHRRGLLFVGLPGNGKTMMIRHIIRECHKKYGAESWMLCIRRRTGEDDIRGILNEASSNVSGTPGIVIFEDMESLTNESSMTRASLLSILDGVNPREGVLILGTTNNPELVDPALIHRPSRFDRVWRFALPSRNLREKYIKNSIPILTQNEVDELAGCSEGWSFAYLNELRITAAMSAITDGHEELTSEYVFKSFDLLASQFKAGEKQTCEDERHHAAGFQPGGAASDDEESD